MLIRIAVFGLLALGLGGFGTVAWLATRPPPESRAADAPAPPPVHHFVLAATPPLRAGTLLKAEDLASQDLPDGARRAGGQRRASVPG